MSSLSFRGVIIQVKAGKKEAGAVIGSAQSKLLPPRTNPRELLPVTKSCLSRLVPSFTVLPLPVLKM